MGERKDQALNEFAIREFLQTDARRIVAGLALLPERQRAVVILHYYADMDLARIAAALSTSEGAVKQTVHTRTD